MSKKKLFHFSGYATKVDLKCADGRTIRKDAFKDNDGQKVPLVWQHIHNDPGNVLGHAVLENREDGVYAYCTFNDTTAGQNAKQLVEHGDITSLSIYANNLKEKAKNVLHGMIREVSLVLSGANPGALIDNLSIQHGDGTEETIDSEVIIYSGQEISTKEVSLDLEEEIKHEAGEDETLGDIFQTLSDKQKQVVYALIGQALDSDEDDDVEHSEEDEDEEILKHEGGNNDMKKNIFDNDDNKGNTLTHDQFQTIIATANQTGSLKEAVLAHAVDYGIENIDVLFPDAKSLKRDPDWLKREDDWVSVVLNAVHKSPFSRVKSVIADMDIDTARAKGYIKATEKKEVYFKAAKRVTTPQTVYVKQKLDRDDILDVVDFDIVAMVRFQLRTLLDEELAQALLIGDGRDPGDQYKINEDNIRPVWKDEELYTIKETVTDKVDYKAMIKEIALTHKRYKGSGSPVLYTTPDIHTNMLWVEDTMGRRIYETDAMLTAALRVSKIVEIDRIDGLTREIGANTHELLGIKVNLRDYNIGADKGGNVATFDDFDIDFNQYKYLMETRVSGALTKPKCAQVYEHVTETPVG